MDRVTSGGDTILIRPLCFPKAGHLLPNFVFQVSVTIWLKMG